MNKGPSQSKIHSYWRIRFEASAARTQGSTELNAREIKLSLEDTLEASLSSGLRSF